MYGQTPKLLLEKGSGAIDFTLHDYPDGNSWNLRDQLEQGGKPVVLIWGMYTCPAFQGMGDKPPISPWDMCSYWDEYKLVRRGGAVCVWGEGEGDWPFFDRMACGSDPFARRGTDCCMGFLVTCCSVVYVFVSRIHGPSV